MISQDVSRQRQNETSRPAELHMYNSMVQTMAAANVLQCHFRTCMLALLGLQWLPADTVTQSRQLAQINESCTEFHAHAHA